MKTCVYCHASIPNEANFCPHCGNSQPNPTPQYVPGIYDCVNLRVLVIPCACLDNGAIGNVQISPVGVIFESNSDTIQGFLNTLALFGRKTRFSFALKSLKYMGILGHGLQLFICLDDGTHYLLGGPTYWGISKNRETIKRIAYIIELYRRMYWYYGGYQQGGVSLNYPIGYHKDSQIRFHELSDEALINFFLNIV